MRAHLLLFHSIPELYELGLVGREECTALLNAGLASAGDLRDHFAAHGNFTALAGLSDIGKARIVQLADAYEKAERGARTHKELYALDVFDEDVPIIPIRIDWKRFTGMKRDFLNECIGSAVRDRGDPEQQRFLVDYLGVATDAESFYNKAIVHPLREGAPSVRDGPHGGLIRHLIRVFLWYYQATQLLDDAYELLRAYAHIEFRMDPDHEAHWRTRKLYADGSFPFAHAAYRFVLASPRFTYVRGFRDINRMRYVNIFNEQPYTYGDLGAHFGMSERFFTFCKQEADRYAENGCRAVFAMLKVLRFEHNYRAHPEWDERALRKELVSAINHREELDLPAAFYALLFDELYALSFTRNSRNEWCVTAKAKNA